MSFNVKLGKEKVCNMSYLQFKWGEMFSLLDVNHDHKLDTTDIQKPFRNI